MYLMDAVYIHSDRTHRHYIKNNGHVGSVGYDSNYNYDLYGFQTIFLSIYTF